MEAKLEFHGDGPFDLPVAQRCLAAGTGEAVVISFRVLVRSNQAATVRIAVSNDQARELAASILSALPSSS